MTGVWFTFSSDQSLRYPRRAILASPHAWRDIPISLIEGLRQPTVRVNECNRLIATTDFRICPNAAGAISEFGESGRRTRPRPCQLGGYPSDLLKRWKTPTCVGVRRGNALRSGRLYFLGGSLGEFFTSPSILDGGLTCEDQSEYGSARDNNRLGNLPPEQNCKADSSN